MKFKNLSIVFTLALAITFIGCSGDDDNNPLPLPTPTLVTKAQVIQNHANIVYTSYLDSYNKAVEMQTAINDFVDNPTQAGLTAAKNAWLAAREPYGQTEAYRGETGPIDSDPEEHSWALNNEGQLNAWPMEEAIIDYVATGSAGTGSYDFGSIIGNTTITINEATIKSYAEYGDNEAAVTTGWHAIEFLLWGQDNTMPDQKIPGQRAYTDYTTADNATRRGQYLKVVTTLLVKDLNDLVMTWNTGGTYRAVFDALNEDTAIKEFIYGAFFIAGDELSVERMSVAVDSEGGIGGLGQEDEHSCFADNTNRDVFTNAQGVYNVIFGMYGNSINGASFYDLVNQTNPTQAASLKAAAEDAMAKVTVIGNNADPFDYLITQESSTDSPQGPVMQAVTALQTWANEISASALVLGINLSE